MEIPNFRIYVYRLFKSIHPDLCMSRGAQEVLQGYLEFTFARIMKYVSLVTIDNGSATVSSRGVQTAVRVVLNGELAKRAVAAGVKAVTIFTTTPPAARRALTRSKRAGLTLNVARVERSMRLNTSRRRFGEASAIYMTAVLEYLVSEICALAGRCVLDNKRRRLTLQDITLAIHNDDKLRGFYGAVVTMGRLPPPIPTA